MWVEKKYADLWSLVHFLFGVVFTFLASFLELSFNTALIALIAIAIIWEVLEILSGKAIEYKMNRLTDIIFSVVGFLITHYIFITNQVSDQVT